MIGDVAESPMPFGVSPVHHPSDGLYHHRTLPVSNAFRRFPVHHRSRATSARREGVGVSNAFRRFPAASPRSRDDQGRYVRPDVSNAFRRSVLTKQPHIVVDQGASFTSPVPFGVQPLRDRRHPHHRSPARQVSNAFRRFLCSPVHQFGVNGRHKAVSPMPFGVPPLRDADERRANRRTNPRVSNAFRRSVLTGPPRPSSRLMKSHARLQCLSAFPSSFTAFMR